MRNFSWLSIFWNDVSAKLLARKADRLEFLKKNVFFQGFSERQIALTCEFLHERRFAANESIFEIGHPGAALYWVETGDVRIEIPYEKQEPVILATLKAGAFFGELALIDEAPRSATARAIGETTVLALPRSELQRMLQESPALASLVYRALAQITGSRLKATIEKMHAEQSQVKMVVNG